MSDNLTQSLLNSYQSCYSALEYKNMLSSVQTAVNDYIDTFTTNASQHMQRMESQIALQLSAALDTISERASHRNGENTKVGSKNDQCQEPCGTSASLIIM